MSRHCTCEVPHLAEWYAFQGYNEDYNGLVCEEEVDASFAKPFESFGYGYAMSVLQHGSEGHDGEGTEAEIDHQDRNFDEGNDGFVYDDHRKSQL